MTIMQCKACTISMPPMTKFRHTYFSRDEFIYRDENFELRCEGGGYLIENEFWANKWNNPLFQDGWEIVK